MPFDNFSPRDTAVGSEILKHLSLAFISPYVVNNSIFINDSNKITKKTPCIKAGRSFYSMLFKEHS